MNSYELPGTSCFSEHCPKANSSANKATQTPIFTKIQRENRRSDPSAVHWKVKYVHRSATLCRRERERERENRSGERIRPHHHHHYSTHLPRVKHTHDWSHDCLQTPGTFTQDAFLLSKTTQWGRIERTGFKRTFKTAFSRKALWHDDQTRLSTSNPHHWVKRFSLLKVCYTTQKLICRVK